MLYVIQSVLILVAPAPFAASVYMCLGRIIRSVNGHKHSLISPRKLTLTFVLGEVASFFIPGSGAGLMVKGNSVKLGEGIIIARLVIQVTMFGLFAATAVIFERRIKQNPTPTSLNTTLPWKQSFHMLYAVSAFIMIRSIFRVVEYAMGNSGYPLKHEWTLYIFDSLLMLGVMVIYYLRYPYWISPKHMESTAIGI